jgi:methionyl-tRNA synthetase
VLGLLRRSHAGTIPAPDDDVATAPLREQALALPQAIDRVLDAFALDEALAAIFAVVGLANRTLDRTAPGRWFATAIWRAPTGCRAPCSKRYVCSRVSSPFLPLAQLRAALQVRDDGDARTWTALHEGTPLLPALSLFPRILPADHSDATAREPISSS